MNENEKHIEEFIKGIEFDDAPRRDHRNSLERKFLRAFPKHRLQRTVTTVWKWSTIMNNKVTKFVTAAVILIAVGLLFTVMEKTTTPAYAIEQTIEAMRSINSIHAYCTDWDNSQGEVWVQIDPETGREEYYYADQGDLLIVGTPEKTYYYYKQENLVRIRNEYVPASDIRFSRFFEDVVDWVQKYHGDISFESLFDQELQKEIIMVHLTIPAQENIGEKELVIRVDFETKLPIDMEAIKCGPGQGVKSVDRLEYNVLIPEGIFEFEIPEGAKVTEE